MTKKAIFTFCFLCLFINISGLNGISNLFIRFIITGIITLPFTYFLLKINPFKKLGVFLIFLYFFLSTFAVVYGILYNQKVIGLLTYLIYVVSIIFSLLIYYKSNLKVFISIYILIFSLAIYQHDNLLNRYVDFITKNENVNKKIPHIKIVDSNNNIKNIFTKDKIYVIDIWSNSCSYCVKKFPDFDKVFNHYKNKKNVEVFALNVILDDFDKKKTLRLVNGYQFKNYYTDSTILKKLKFNEFPNYLVLSKEGNVVYFGSLNIDKNESYNNLYKIVDNEINK